MELKEWNIKTGSYIELKAHKVKNMNHKEFLRKPKKYGDHLQKIKYQFLLNE